MRLKADLLLFMVAVIWGTAFVAQGIAGQYGIAYLYNGVSFMLAGLILIPFIPRGQALPSPKSAFGDYIATLAGTLEDFDKPVLYFHGDTHLFRTDKPLYSAKTGRAFENFTRVEVFGWPDSHWVKIEVDPSDPQLFVVKPQIVPENRASRQSK